jgi:hypothetical protein
MPAKMRGGENPRALTASCVIAGAERGCPRQWEISSGGDDAIDRGVLPAPDERQGHWAQGLASRSVDGFAAMGFARGQPG